MDNTLKAAGVQQQSASDGPLDSEIEREGRRLMEAMATLDQRLAKLSERLRIVLVPEAKHTEKPEIGESGPHSEMGQFLRSRKSHADALIDVLDRLDDRLAL